jgi:general stress protein YciG
LLVRVRPHSCRRIASVPGHFARKGQAKACKLARGLLAMRADFGAGSPRAWDAPAGDGCRARSALNGAAREAEASKMVKDGRTSHGATTVVEAGRKGGQRVKELYGAEFYAEIGRKGGRSIADERGPDYYAAIGKKGGQTVRQRHGSLFFSQIGKKGGEAVKSKHGPDYYSRIGKKGGEAPRRAR